MKVTQKTIFILLILGLLILIDFGYRKYYQTPLIIGQITQDLTSNCPDNLVQTLNYKGIINGEPCSYSCVKGIPEWVRRMEKNKPILKKYGLENAYTFRHHLPQSVSDNDCFIHSESSKISIYLLRQNKGYIEVLVPITKTGPFYFQGN